MGLFDNLISPIASNAVGEALTSLEWAAITSTPTTLSGYGITDAQSLDGDLTAIAALSGTGVARRTGINTWILDDGLLYFNEASSITSPYTAVDSSVTLSAIALGSNRTTIQITPHNNGGFVLGATPASLPALGSRIFGLSSLVTAQYGTSIGRSSTVSASDACTIGYASVASQPYAIALGAESVANAAYATTVSRGNAYGREGSLSLGHSFGNHYQGSWTVYGREINPAGTFDLTASGGAANTSNIILLRDLSLNKLIGDVVVRSPTGDCASWSVHETWERNGATYTQKFNASALNFADAGAAAWTMTVVQDATNGGVKVQVNADENGTFATAFIKLVEVY